MSTLKVNAIQNLSSQNIRGQIIQVIDTKQTNLVFTTNTSAYTDVDTLSITLSSSSNKVLVLANYGVSGNGSMYIDRNGTALTRSATSQTYAHWEVDSSSGANYDSSTLRSQFTIQHLDTPGTTSLTYKTKIISYSVGFAVQPPPYAGTFSSFVLMEIAV